MNRRQRNTTCRVGLRDYRPLVASAFVAGMQLPLLPRPEQLGFSSTNFSHRTARETTSGSHASHYCSMVAKREKETLSRVVHGRLIIREMKIMFRASVKSKVQWKR